MRLLFAWTLKGERRIFGARVLRLSPRRLAGDLEVQVRSSCLFFFFFSLLTHFKCPFLCQF